MKRNVTVQLDEAVISKAKVVAARRGTSVSALVAREIETLADRHDRYEAARVAAMRALQAAPARGGRGWTRDELHER